MTNLSINRSNEEYQEAGSRRRPEAITSRTLRRILLARQSRGSFFPPVLFSDPAWDLLLFLFEAHLDQRRVAVSELVSSPNYAEPTLHKWLGELESHKLVSRFTDRMDGTPILVALSFNGTVAMSEHFQICGFGPARL